MDRRDFLKSIGSAIGTTWASRSWAQEFIRPQKSAIKPNFLLIGTDDLRCELACYGQRYIHSPNIDELASQGVMFEHAYVQQAVCAASRASFLTGCRPDTTGVNYPYTEWFKTQGIKKYPPMASYFYQNGYFVRTFGKIHHGPPDKTSEPHFHGGPYYYALSENVKGEGQRKQGKDLPPFEMAEVPDSTYLDGKLCDETIATLRRIVKGNASRPRRNRQPFFLAVGFMKPHLPFNAPKKYWDLYEREEIPLSPNPTAPKGTPDYALAHYELRNFKGPNDIDGKRLPDASARQLRHGYFACISYIDNQVGRLLAEMDILGIRENTIIIFMSDNGYHLGDHGCWGKSTNFERATHTPLIISAPGFKANGKKSNSLVEYVDIYPTLLELAGLPALDHLEGNSTVPILKEPTRPWKKAVFSQIRRGARKGFAIRTSRYCYVEWQRRYGKVDATELYDLINDPEESVNIAQKSENKELVESLAEQLKAGWKSALPKGIVNRSNNPVAPGIW